MPQNKITDPAGNGDLPSLSEIQQKYVEARAAGKRSVDAYRAATDTSRQKPETTWRKAAELEANGKVRAWLAAIQAQTVESGSYTLQDHIQELDAFARRAEAAGNYGAAGQALKAKGAAIGHYIERTMDLTPRADMDKTLADIEAWLGPDARQRAARMLGLQQTTSDKTH